MSEIQALFVALAVMAFFYLNPLSLLAILLVHWADRRQRRNKTARAA